ncbi:glutamic acid-rich protein [Carica papaya]|uniref:glutamic acid-rich protein n=1 Tax=Carica papaya TaxID=3649 RepID=UPI000B8CF9B1|nr:glutamic acid-rich protein [Carica papaya]
MDENSSNALSTSKARGNFFIKSQLLKKLTKLLLLSVSVFSLFFSQKSNFLSFLHSCNFFSHAIDKNFMFLLCNGLVVFVAKFSGLITSSSSSSSPSRQNNNNNLLGYDDDQSLMIINNYEDVREQFKLSVTIMEKETDAGEEVEDDVAAAIEDEVPVAEEKGGETEKIIMEDKGVGKGESETLLIRREEEEEEEEDDDDNGVLDDDEEVRLDVEGNGKLSTEELNKKFDEFIRKMKEELRIEAQRQLIMV